MTKFTNANSTAWIRKYCENAIDKKTVYALYGKFVQETGSRMSQDSYKAAVRNIFFNGPRQDYGGIRVLKDAEGPNLNIVTESHQIRTLEQLLAYCKVNMETWKVTRHVVNMWGGEANPNFQVKAWLSRKEWAEPQTEINHILEDAKGYMPKYPKLSRPKGDGSGNLFEISLFDHHFGQLSWGKETRGENYDVKIARRLALAAVDYLLAQIQDKQIDKILLPVGNDFFNVNNMLNITAHGTHQSEDERWKKTYVGGRKLWVEIIEMCLSVAPVAVILIPGNHDEERSFYLGDALECWFNKAQEVCVNNSPTFRKYYRWGDCLIGFTHGDRERKGVLVNLMATEVPMDWAQTKYREWHAGHYHAARAQAFQVLDEELGVREWILPSLVAIDDYHAGKGYSHLRESMGMLWNKDRGKTEMHMYHPPT